MNKFLNIPFIRGMQHKQYISSDSIAKKLGLTLDEWYIMLNYTQVLPPDKVTILADVLNVKEEYLYD
jgi:hypothetical protein